MIISSVNALDVDVVEDLQASNVKYASNMSILQTSIFIELILLINGINFLLSMVLQPLLYSLNQFLTCPNNCINLGDKTTNQNTQGVPFTTMANLAPQEQTTWIPDSNASYHVTRESQNI